MMSKINYAVGGNDAIPTETPATRETVTRETATQETEKSETVKESTEQETKQMTIQKDEYISSREKAPSGLYNVSKDKDGKTVISYEDPNKKQDGQQMLSSVVKLKSKRDSIKLKLKSEPDSNKAAELKKKLKEVEKQLKNAK